MAHLKKLYYCIILLSSVNCNAPKNINRMQNFLTAHGDYIDYEIFPIHKKVQLSIIRNKSEFDSIIK